jgi:spermidine synthase
MRQLQSGLGLPAVNLRLLFHVVLFLFVALAALASADEKVLYEKASAFGTIVVTEDDDGLRVLRFGRSGARQSVVKPGDPDYLGLPYVRGALVGLALCEEPRRVLVVGLGGATLPMFLRKHYPDAAIDAVDVDPDVVDAAKQFFGFREDERMRAHIADGRQFIEQSRQPYDAIFLDAFGSDSVPAHLTTQEFLRAVRRALKPGGVLIGNLWASYVNPLYDSMVRTYQEVFDEVYILEVQGTGNVIVLALPRRQSLRQDELAKLARKVSTVRNFGFDAGDLVNSRFMHAREKTLRGRILMDRDLKQPSGETIESK